MGTVIGLFFNLLVRIFIARFYTPADYGLFNIYLTILSIFATFGSIGLAAGISRNIAYYIGKNEKEKIPSIIGWGVAIGLATSITLGAVLFLFAYPIASLFSDDPILGYYFRIAAIVIPFSVLSVSLKSVFRGFQRIKERIIFQDLGKNFLVLALILIIGFFALDFQNVILAKAGTGILISIMLLIYFIKNKKKLLGIKKTFEWSPSIGKELLLFSTPLLLVNIMHSVTSWTDTMLISYFLIEDFVGYYQAAEPLSHIIGIALSVTHFLYNPLVTTFYAQNKIQKNRIIFTTITKWICFGTLPIALILIFYPSWVVTFFYGEEYIAAVIPLQILAMRAFFNNFVGPVGGTLKAYGKTKFLMYATGTSAGLNVILNIILIPYYGIIGAAIATAISTTYFSIIKVKKLKDISGIHPIRYQIIKPIILSTIIGFFLIYLVKHFFPINIILIAISVVSFYLIYLFSMIYTKSISNDDIKLLLLVERRLGLDLSRIKNLLKKFV